MKQRRGGESDSNRRREETIGQGDDVHTASATSSPRASPRASPRVPSPPRQQGVPVPRFGNTLRPGSVALRPTVPWRRPASSPTRGRATWVVRDAAQRVRCRGRTPAARDEPGLHRCEPCLPARSAKRRGPPCLPSPKRQAQGALRASQPEAPSAGALYSSATAPYPRSHGVVHSAGAHDLPRPQSSRINRGDRIGIRTGSLRADRAESRTAASPPRRERS